MNINLIDLLSIEVSSTQKVINYSNDDYHENFGFQWNKFNKLQLDSFNGSSESEERFFTQNNLKPADLMNKTVLEVGAGCGRFTEIMLKYDARVIAVDYSSAIQANFLNHKQFSENEQLICIQADVFDMPLKKNSFDIVLCYGVIQHTGRNEACLNMLCEYLTDSGILLVDIYSNSLKHYNPWVYLVRPFFSRIKNYESQMNLVEKFVSFVFPFQLKLLTWLHEKKGILKYIRYFVNRSPNSVYGINLFLDGKISLEHAKDWSVMDTFDGWMPNHDDPVSKKEWEQLLQNISSIYDLKIDINKICGQGYCAQLSKDEVSDSL